MFALTIPLAFLAYWLVNSAMEARGQKPDFRIEPLIAFFATLLGCPLIALVIGYSFSKPSYPPSHETAAMVSRAWSVASRILRPRPRRENRSAALVVAGFSLCPLPTTNCHASGLTIARKTAGGYRRFLAPLSEPPVYLSGTAFFLMYSSTALERAPPPMWWNASAYWTPCLWPRARRRSRMNSLM